MAAKQHRGAIEQRLSVFLNFVQRLEQSIQNAHNGLFVVCQRLDFFGIAGVVRQSVDLPLFPAPLRNTSSPPEEAAKETPPVHGERSGAKWRQDEPRERECG